MCDSRYAFAPFPPGLSSLGARSTLCSSAVSRRSRATSTRRTLRAAVYESPIDVPTTEKQNVYTDSAAYAPILDEGRNVSFLVEHEEDGFNYHLNVLGGDWIGDISVNGIRYELDQLHLHTPAENHLDGKEHDLEMHLVHRCANNICVVAIFFKEGKKNDQIESILDAMKNKDQDEEDDVKVKNIDVKSLIGKTDTTHGKNNLIKFLGSLTTPPYTQGVQWVVSQDVHEVSKEQISAFKELQKVRTPNDRPIKDMNNRLITLYK